MRPPNVIQRSGPQRATVWLSFLLVFTGLTAHAQHFTVTDGVLYDPAGNRFTPYGGNVNGANYFDWGCPENNWLNYESSVMFSEEGINKLINGWRWNFLRANVFLKDPTWQGTTFADGWLSNPGRVEQHIDRLVQTYTSRDVVVMLEIHDFTCDNFNQASPQDIADLENFWRMTATKYRDNPFVWFNIINEPGWYGDEAQGVDVKYRDVHRRIIQTIRDQGAANVIAIDGSQCGQDAVKTNGDLIVENMSGILKWGTAIQEGFSNVLFNIHLYDLWAGSGNNNYAVAKFDDYIARVRSKGLCLPFVGECGSNGSPNHDRSAEFAYKVALKRHGVGTVAWHAFDGDRFSLCKEAGTKASRWATAIDDLANPTNLSDLNGRWHWQGTHEDGYGTLAQRASPPEETLLVRARGYQGGEQITLRLDGQDVQTWTMTTSLTDYRYNGAWAGKQVQVAFTNDSVGRDAFVDYVQLGSTTLQAEDQAVNTAVWENGSCGGNYSEWMQCTGYIEFDTVTNARLVGQKQKPVLGKVGSGVPAFPGAEGGGAASQGGRGGKIIEVTNLNDSGPGSLRAAVETSGKRIIVFRKGGIITLKTPLEFKEPYVTLAGQTAPGGGVLIKGNYLSFHESVHDVVVRYLAVWLGSEAGFSGQGGDCVSIGDGAHHLIFDHCSFGWSQDETIGIWSDTEPVYGITFSNNIIAEALNYDHVGSGFIVGSNVNSEDIGGISIIRNAFFSNFNRNPLLKCGDGQIINNIIFNADKYATMLAGGIEIDIVGNLYQAGPDSDDRYVILHRPHDGTPNTGPAGNPSVYLSGNKGQNGEATWQKLVEQTAVAHWGYPGSPPKRKTLNQQFERTTPLAKEIYTRYPVKVLAVDDLENELLPTVGASQKLNEDGLLINNRNAIDLRLLSEYEQKEGSNPFSENDAGGYPIISSGVPYTDTDHDAMPDVWEEQYGFDKNDASDSNQDADDDGYTNVEEFLNGTPPITGSPSNLTYTVRARGLQGTERMALLIGGKTVQSWTVGTRAQDYSYTGSESGSVRVAFTNDQGKGHDLVVNKLRVGGAEYLAKEQAVNTGVWQNKRCGGTKSEWLHCSGYIEFAVGAANARQASLKQKPILSQTSSEVLIYPNPSRTGSFTVMGATEKDQVEMYDLQGRKIVLIQIFEQQQLRIRPQNRLPVGLYILQVKTVTGALTQYKLAME
jgi:hypothetical protein